MACDRNNFITAKVATSDNVHDSCMFEEVYGSVTEQFPDIETVAVDAGYKTPAICKKVINDERNISMPCKRPMGGDGYFRPYEYVCDEYFNCVIRPEDKVLEYAGEDRAGYRKLKAVPQTAKSAKAKKNLLSAR